MTDEKLGKLYEAFSNYYWCVPKNFVTGKIAEWHPEVDRRQVERVLKKCTDSLFWHHCTVLELGEEPVIVVEHLIAFGGDDLERFLAARMDVSYADCDEETLFVMDSAYPDIPEAHAIFDFGKTELGLDDEWAEQLVHDCVLAQPYALCGGQSWVMDVLHQEQYGKIHFRTTDQIQKFRELGNRLFQVVPNPVLKGWKPVEIDSPVAVPDDIPDKDEDIPDSRAKIDKFFESLGGREKAAELMMQHLSELDTDVSKRKIGRNELCPCGSGKKYKRCCGR